MLRTDVLVCTAPLEAMYVSGTTNSVFGTVIETLF
jgi:hypothetical protein